MVELFLYEPDFDYSKIEQFIIVSCIFSCFFSCLMLFSDNNEYF